MANSGLGMNYIIKKIYLLYRYVSHILYKIPILL